MKKTMVLGASTNPERYAFRATQRLARHGHEVIPVGLKEGDIGGISIMQGQPEVPNLDTITLYLGPERQRDYYDYILSLQPKRIIFNPGTENPELAQLGEKQGIEIVEGCTLVMLSIGTY
jgi:predicted CoA-binding protein